MNIMSWISALPKSGAPRFYNLENERSCLVFDARNGGIKFRELDETASQTTKSGFLDLREYANDIGGFAIQVRKDHLGKKAIWMLHAQKTPKSPFGPSFGAPIYTENAGIKPKPLAVSAFRAMAEFQRMRGITATAKCGRGNNRPQFPKAGTFTGVIAPHFSDFSKTPVRKHPIEPAWKNA